MKMTGIILIAMVLGFGAAGCHKKGMVKPSGEGKTAADAAGRGALEPGESAVTATPEPSIRGKRFEDAGLLPVYFDYDSAIIRPDGAGSLRRNAAKMKSYSGLTILVEGHCDERGTTEYNLSLGQRRAAALREFYAGLGIDASSVGTISYGEERPICFDSTESCWVRNRRGETRVQQKAVK